MSRPKKSAARVASAPIANEHRGEIALAIDGARMVMRPSFEAIVAFEGATGKSLMQLAQQGIDHKLSLAEVAQIATETIRAWGRANNDRNASGASAERIAELILDAPGGYRDALLAVGAMLALAATGGYTAKGEPKAATGMTTSAPNAAG